MKQRSMTGPELTGLVDFFNLYEAARTEIDAVLLQRIQQVPQLATLLRNLTPAQLEANTARSAELRKRVAQTGDLSEYLDDLRTQASAYAATGISFGAWVELTSAFQEVLLERLVQGLGKDPNRLVQALQSMQRYMEISIAELGEAYLAAKEDQIRHQQRALLELSTPVLQVRDRLLILPLIGILDTRRARQLTEQLLDGIRTARARVVVMDITGVPAVDTAVANHLLQTVAAARLMGATVVVSGLSADVAQALVKLGVDLDPLHTVGDLQGAFEVAEHLLSQPVGGLRALSGSSDGPKAP